MNNVDFGRRAVLDVLHHPIKAIAFGIGLFAIFRKILESGDLFVFPPSSRSTSSLEASRVQSLHEESDRIIKEYEKYTKFKTSSNLNKFAVNVLGDDFPRLFQIINEKKLIKSCRAKAFQLHPDKVGLLKGIDKTKLLSASQIVNALCTQLEKTITDLKKIRRIIEIDSSNDSTQVKSCKIYEKFCKKMNNKEIGHTIDLIGKIKAEFDVFERNVFYIPFLRKVIPHFFWSLFIINSKIKEDYFELSEQVEEIEVSISSMTTLLDELDQGLDSKGRPFISEVLPSESEKDIALPDHARAREIVVKHQEKIRKKIIEFREKLYILILRAEELKDAVYSLKFISN